MKGLIPWPFVLLMLLGVFALFGMTSSTQAAPMSISADCELWASAGPWDVARCQNYSTGDVCFVASSGMMQCKFGD